MCESADEQVSLGAGRLAKVVDLVEIAGTLRPLTAVMAGGERVPDLRLLESARDHGIIDRIILIGHYDRIAAAVEAVGVTIDKADIVNADNDEAAAAATVEHIASGVAEMVLKGSTPTHVLHRHMLPLATRDTASLVSIFDAASIGDGRPMILTDAGVTTVCNYGRMAGLIRNAVDVARSVMRVDRPRVALLSANEKQVASLPSTRMGATFAAAGWPDADVYGPLQFDLATDPAAVALKGLPDTPAAQAVGGQADVLVCPGIDAANVIYKMLSAMIKYGEASLANIIMGFPMPYVLLSRSDALETRLNSLALGAIYAQRFCETAPSPSVTAPAPTHRVLVVNPGSTSTKLAVFAGERCIFDRETPFVTSTPTTADERRAQADALYEQVVQEVQRADCGAIDAIAARGGFVPRPPGKLQGGVYVVAERNAEGIVVDDALVAALLEHPEREHASNLGIPVAAALARSFGVPAYTVDPVVVDEFSPEAEISGLNGIVRRSTAHALSVRAAACKAAQSVGRPLDQTSVVVAHLGGGITVAAVQQGRITDNTIALLGGGPFTPQRAGELPTGAVVDLCFSEGASKQAVIRQMTRQGGIQSYLNEYRLPEIEQRIAGGDAHAGVIMDAMLYQIAKHIGAMFVAAGCEADAIVLTGGMVRSKRVCDGLRRRVGLLAPVLVFEGSLEMEALAMGTMNALSGAVEARRYPGCC